MYRSKQDRDCIFRLHTILKRDIDSDNDRRLIPSNLIEKKKRKKEEKEKESRIGSLSPNLSTCGF